MKPYTLTNREGESISPMTSTKTVFDEKGVDLDTLLSQQKQDADNALKDYAKSTEVAQGLNAKQDKLSTTTDLHITDDNILGLTELAKMRLFIDQWNAACGKYGRYNPETGYFELNGLTDITYEEAVQIYRYYSPTGYVRQRYWGAKIRTNIPSFLRDVENLVSAFYASSIEVIRISSGSWIRGDFSAAFRNCLKLREILDPQLEVSNSNTLIFENCRQLEEVRVKFTGKTIYFYNSPKLSLESLKYLVVNSNRNFTAYVHADVYAKLTGDTSNAAAAELTEEELAQWQQLLEDAAEKQITFATT